MSNILIIAPNTDTRVAYSVINSPILNDLTTNIFFGNFKNGIFRNKKTDWRFFKSFGTGKVWWLRFGNSLKCTISSGGVKRDVVVTSGEL